MTLTALDQLKLGKIELAYRKKTKLRPRLCTFREEYSLRSRLVEGSHVGLRAQVLTYIVRDNALRSVRGAL